MSEKSASADNRSVATDALGTLGTIIDEGAARDAIHLAVLPAVAGHEMRPGQHVVLNDLGEAVPAYIGKGVGIVDPFLPGPVLRGQRFWLVVYPRTITSLRHVWAHPAFPDAQAPLTEDELDRRRQFVADPETVRSKAWLREYAEQLDVGYRDLMASAKDWVANGEYMCRGGTLEGVSTPPEFWPHYARVTGEDVPAGKKENFFTCSC